MIDIEKLLTHCDLERLVEDAGGKLRHRNCACPLHGGDNPTGFGIWVAGDGTQLWKCRTRDCGSGTAIQFVMAHQRLDWMGAVRWLAARFNVDMASLGMDEQAVQEAAQQARRADVLELAARYYVERRRKQRPRTLLAYLMRQRGFSRRTVARAGYGYSDGLGLEDYLRTHRADMNLAHEMGLVRRDGMDFTANADGRRVSPDGWLVYVHREYGRVVGLSARALTPGVKDKSRNLPGDRRAYRASVRADRTITLVEGQADADSIAQWGWSAWALAGTASVHERDLAHARRARAIYLLLDGDRAGRARLAAIGDQCGPLTMVCAPAEGYKDANEALQHGAGPELVERARNHARPWLEMRIEMAADAPAYEHEEHITAVVALMALLPEAQRGRWVTKAAKATGVAARELRERVTEHLRTASDGLQRAEVREGALMFDGVRLLNGTCRISKQLTRHDGLSAPQVLYALEAHLTSGKRLNGLEVKADEFQSCKWLAGWGIDVMVDVPPRQAWMLPRAIQEISMAQVARENIYIHTGWTNIDGQHAYLSTSGAITAEGLRSDVRVELGHPGSPLRRYALPAPPEDPRAAMQESLSFIHLAPPTVTWPIWAAMYCAPLGEWRTMDAMLWVHGITQSKKSTLTLLALTHYGPEFVEGTKFHAPADWLSTATSLESALFTCKDMPLVIDDYAPQSSEEEQRRLRQTAQRVIRSVGNRAGRGRGNGDGTDRLVRPPRALAIATAEKTLDVQSTVGRMVEVPIPKGTVADRSAAEGVPSPLSRAQDVNGAGGPGLYGQAMASYIRWIARNWDDVGAAVQTTYRGYQSAAKQLFTGDQSRLTDSFATLMTGIEMALTYAADSEAISNDQMRLYLEQAQTAIVEVLRSHSRSVSEQSPVARLFAALDILLTQNRLYIQPRTASAPLPPATPERAALLGWYDAQDTVYLLAPVCIQECRRYYKDLGEGFDINTMGLSRELAHHGMLDSRPAGAGRNTASVWAGGSTNNTLPVSSRAIHERFGVALHPDHRRLLATA